MNSSMAPSNTDKKRKQAERSDVTVPSDSQLEMLPKMARLLQDMKERDGERGSTATCNNRNQEIYDSESLLNDIHTMKRKLDEYSNRVYTQLLEKQVARIRGLFDST